MRHVDIQGNQTSDLMRSLRNLNKLLLGAPNRRDAPCNARPVKVQATLTGNSNTGTHAGYIPLMSRIRHIKKVGVIKKGPHLTNRSEI